jgi:DNA-binding MarR family transcriptional regulator
MRQFRKNLRKLERKLAGRIDGDMVCCGVTTAQCHTLLAIQEKGLTTVTELAAELELDKSTLSRAIDALVATGLVHRETNTDNRRSQHIGLTPQGEKATAGIDDQWNRYFVSLFTRIPEAKQQAVLEGISVLSGILPFPDGCCETKGGKGQGSQEIGNANRTTVKGDIS